MAIAESRWVCPVWECDTVAHAVSAQQAHARAQALIQCYVHVLTYKGDLTFSFKFGMILV